MLKAEIEFRDPDPLITLTQSVPNDNEDDNGTETTSAEFFCTIPGD